MFDQYTVFIGPPNGMRPARRMIRGVPQFVIDPQAPPLACDIRHTADRDAWQSRVGEQIRTLFNVERGPLFRVEGIFSSTDAACDLLLTGHHCILDGMSLIQLSRELLRLLEELPDTVEAVPWVRLRQLTRRPVGWWFSLRHCLAHFRRTGNSRKNPCAAIDWQADQPEVYRYVILDEAETTRLVARTKSERATVFGALLAAATRTSAAEPPEPDCRLIARVPYSTRAWSDPPVGAEQVGLYVSGMRLSLEQPFHTPFWDIARESRAVMEQYFAANAPVFTWNLLSRFGKWIVRRMIRMPIAGGHIAVNSLGNLVEFRSPSGALRITEFCWFHHDAGVSPPGILVKGATVNGRLNLIIASCRHTAETLPGYVEKYLSCLRRAIQEPGTPDCPNRGRAAVGSHRGKRPGSSRFAHWICTLAGS